MARQVTNPDGSISLLDRYAQFAFGDVGSVRTVHQVIESEFDPNGINGEWVACGEACGPGWTSADGGLTYTAPVAPPPSIPQTLDMRQARLALFTAGLIGSVQAAIDSLPSPDREKAQIELEYGVEVQRHNGFFATLGPALGLSEEQIDALFITGAAL